MGLKVLSLFSGIGAPETALKRIGVDFELVGFSEIDKYAIKTYCALHNVDESLNLGDVTKVDETKLDDFDLLVGGFPCQAFSVAGNRKGFEDTRGTLFFELARIAKYKQPKYVLLENVKGLVNHDKGKTLDIITEVISEIGYTFDFEVLNSKYFNIPQHRERIFIICVRNDLINNEEWNVSDQRKDVVGKGKVRIMEKDNLNTFNFNWPKQEQVTKILREILEKNVDEKFYINEEKSAKLISQLERSGKHFENNTCVDPIQMGRGEIRVYNDLSPTLNSRDYKEPRMIIEPNMLGHINLKGHDAIKRVYDPEGVSPTLTTRGGHREPKIAVKSIGNVNPSGKGMNGQVYDSNGLSPTVTTNKGEGTKIIEDIVCLNTYKNDGTQTSQQDRVYDTNGQMVALTSSLNGRFNIVQDEVRPTLTPDRVDKRQNGRRFKENDEPAFTVNTQDKHGVTIGNYPTYRIRKLTPKECWRLMGFSDEDFEIATELNSNSQLYKQAGNSIVVNVLVHIFKELFSIK